MSAPIVLWHYDDGSWDEAWHDDGKVPPLTNHKALPVAEFDRLTSRLAAMEAALKEARVYVAAACYSPAGLCPCPPNALTVKIDALIGGDR